MSMTTTQTSQWIQISLIYGSRNQWKRTKVIATADLAKWLADGWFVAE
jgi:hypothetical protein